MFCRDGKFLIPVSFCWQIFGSPNFLLSYIIEQQTCFLTLTEKQFSKKTAYDFLNDLAGEFHSQYGHKINTATRPYSFIEFDTYIQVSFLNSFNFSW